MNLDEGGAARERYTALVLSCVEQVPPGFVTTYGDVAESVRAVTGTGGARQVARVMSLDGGAVPWWRCVRADGSLPAALGERAVLHWGSEGTPLVGAERVHMRAAFVTSPAPAV